MDEHTRQNLADIRSADSTRQNEAYYALMAATETPVAWAYDAWDDLLAMLRDPDNHQRAIGAQLLVNLAQRSDPDERILHDFDALLAVTRDERFVTARHSLQALWKVGTAGEAQRRLVVDGLAARFRDCASEKNSTLVRYDISEALRNLYNATGDATIRERALALIETEDDLKYRKKYARPWRAT